MVDHSAPSSGLPLVLAALGRRRWLALAVLTGALAVLVSAVAAVPALYQATSTILVDRQQVPDTFVRSAVVGEVETRLHSLNQQILSRARLEALIRQFDLYPDLRQRAPAEAAVEQMRRDTRFEVKAVEQPGSRAATIAFAVSYRGWNPRVVAEVTNALASLYVEENSRGRERQAAGTAAFLKTQVDDMQHKLEEEERRMGQRPARLEADIVALEGVTTRLRLNSDRQVRAMDQRERLLREPAAAATSAAPDALGVKLAALKQELLVLRTRFTEKYPDVIRVKADIAALERRLAETPVPERAAGATRAGGRDPLTETNGELKALQDEERSLRDSLAALERRIESAPQREQEFQQRARKYAMTKEVYDSLLKRYEDAQIAESMEQGRKGEHFTVLDPAILPKVPVGPNRALLLLVSLGLAAALAVGAVILAERLDSSFHTADELAGFTRVPVMASISHLDTDGDAARRRRRGGLLAAGAVAGLVLVAGGTYMIAQDNETLARVLARAH